MKKNKFAVIATAMVIAGAMSFAQSSMTYTATKRVFKTDVDNYMDVNAWSTVSPEKIFAFTNFYNSQLNLGFAKNFGSLYFGTYFNGTIPGPKTAENATDTYIIDVSSNGGYNNSYPGELDSLFGSSISIPVVNSGNSSFNFSTLFGFGNIGIKVGLYYFPKNFSAKLDYTDEAIDDIIYKINSDSIKPWFNFGYTTELVGKQLMVNAGIEYDFTKGTKEITEGTSTNVTKSNYDTFKISAGASYEFVKEEKIAQTVLFDTSYSANFYPKETHIVNGVSDTTVEQDIFKGTVKLTPAYKLTYNPIDALAIGLTANIPLTIGFGSTEGEKNSSFNMGGNICTGLKYTIKPELAVFNLGGSINLGNLISISSSGNSKSKRKTFFEGYFMDLSTGLTFYLTKNVVLDTSFDVIQYNNTVSLDDIWKTAIGLQLSIKY